MLQNKLTRSILILMTLLITIPLGYSYMLGGESIFPTIPPTSDVTETYTATYGIPTAEIRHSETPIDDVQITYPELTATYIPRSTPIDPGRFQEIVFINHTNSLIRVIITSPDYLDIIIEDVVYLDLVFALHWIYIFVGDTVFVEQVVNNQLYYVNVFEDKIIIGLYKLQP